MHAAVYSDQLQIGTGLQDRLQLVIFGFELLLPVTGSEHEPVECVCLDVPCCFVCLSAALRAW
jgi:hypothetical protein